MNRKIIEDVVFKRFSRSSDDAIVRASFPSFSEEFMKDGGFYRGVGGENRNVLTGGAEDFMDKMSND